MGDTLLSKALKSDKKRRSQITDEEVELALSWMKDEITTAQVAVAYNLTQQSNCLYRVSLALKKAYRDKIISVNNAV